jgi:hypothetical protein
MGKKFSSATTASSPGAHVLSSTGEKAKCVARVLYH